MIRRTNSKLQAIVIISLLNSPALIAQEQDSAEADLNSDSQRLVVEEVFVTGSLLPKGDFVSKAPIATISSTQFEMSNTTNVEALVNSMPQVVGGADRSSTWGSGIATVNLRGLGENRSLVLLNGRRFVPTFPDGGTVDLNFVPVGLIDRVEVLTGGASAAYGSDALAGVVNFILRDDFEGWDFNIGSESSEKGDAEIHNLNVTNGGSFAGGKGRYMIHADYLKREPVFWTDRDISNGIIRDGQDANGNLILVEGDPYYWIFPTSNIVIPGYSTQSIFDDAGSDLSMAETQLDKRKNPNEGFYLQLPQERISLKGNFSFEFSGIEVYADAYYSKSEVPTTNEPPWLGWPTSRSYTVLVEENPYWSEQTKQIVSEGYIQCGWCNSPWVDENANGIVESVDIPWIFRSFQELGSTSIDREFESTQIELGAKGDLSDSWGYEIFGQAGKVDSFIDANPLLNPDRIQQALLVNANGECMDPSDNCVPLNVWGNDIGAQAYDFIRYPEGAGLSSTKTEQIVVMGTLSGNTADWFTIPGDPGPIGLVFGFEYLQIDSKIKTPRFIETQMYEGYAETKPFSLEAGIKRKSIFAEALIPLVSGRPGIDFLELELGFRGADDQQTGWSNTYKVAFSYYPTIDFQVRGSYNRAMRAPSITELYQQRSQEWAGVWDPCLDNNPLKWAGAIAFDSTIESFSLLEASPELAETCIATGLPEQNLYDINYYQYSGIGIDLGGKRDLDPEDSSTLSMGMVWTPEFLDGLSVSIDYFDVEIENYIARTPLEVYEVMRGCFDPALAMGGPGSKACDSIRRDADGRLTSLFMGYQNLGLHELVGWDFNVSFSSEFLTGYLDLAYFATKINKRTIKDNSFGVIDLECKGEFNGPCDITIDNPVPDFKHRFTADWSKGDLDLQLVWKHLSSLEDGQDSAIYYTEKLDSYSIVDLSARYAFTDSMSVILGVKNAFNKQPQPIGTNSWEEREVQIGAQSNTYTQFYDVIGRTIFLKFSGAF